jgi:hypothetical protein
MSHGMPLSFSDVIVNDARNAIISDALPDSYD